MSRVDPRPLSSVCRPKQARSEQTLHRLLDAAEELIQEKGLADVSVPEIVRRAGSSVGGFYARFKDKDELLQALEERFLHRLDEQVVELSDAGVLSGGCDPIGVTPIESWPTGIDQHRLAGRRDEERRLATLDVDDVDVERVPGLATGGGGR